MREFEVLPVQRGERIIGPGPDEIRSVSARIPLREPLNRRDSFEEGRE